MTERSVEMSAEVAERTVYIERMRAANELYFEKVDSVESHGVYRTSEGSDYDSFEFGRMELTTMPKITNTYSKKSYATYYDSLTDNYVLFYTSNGRSFKKVSECEQIFSTHINYLESTTKGLNS